VSESFLRECHEVSSFMGTIDEAQIVREGRTCPDEGGPYHFVFLAGWASRREIICFTFS
jgi:hypothetical protein